MWALGTLKNESDEILIDGFYDNVVSPSAEEMEYVKAIPFEEEEKKRDLGLDEFINKVTGLEAVKALLYEPTCTINGLLTGYTSAGSKTVLPNKAMVKLDFRLVPSQMPDEIFSKLVKHLNRHGFGDIEVTMRGSTEPAKTSTTEGFVQTVIKSAEKVSGKRRLSILLAQPLVHCIFSETGLDIRSFQLGVPTWNLGDMHRTRT